MIGYLSKFIPCYSVLTAPLRRLTSQEVPISWGPEEDAALSFKHHRVTPEHPWANGEAESFMKVLYRTEQIAHSEGRSSNSALQYMLMGYRSTPHPATGYSSYEALMKRNVRTKLDYSSFSISRKYHNMEREINKGDKQYKQKWNNQRRNPKVEKHQFKIGDRVLLKKKSKINGPQLVKNNFIS